MAVKFNRYMVLMVLAGLLLVLLPACSRDKKEQPAEKADLPQEVVTSIRGKVLEISGAGSGSFIFILLDQGKQQIWATVPAVDVKVGEEVTLLNANVVNNFSSKSMNRSFDELIFASGIEGKLSGKRISSISRMAPGNVVKDVAKSSSPAK